MSGVLKTNNASRRTIIDLVRFRAGRRERCRDKNKKWMICHVEHKSRSAAKDWKKKEEGNITFGYMGIFYEGVLCGDCSVVGVVSALASRQNCPWLDSRFLGTLLCEVLRPIHTFRGHRVWFDPCDDKIVIRPVRVRVAPTPQRETEPNGLSSGNAYMRGESAIVWGELSSPSPRYIKFKENEELLDCMLR